MFLEQKMSPTRLKGNLSTSLAGWARDSGRKVGSTGAPAWGPPTDSRLSALVQSRGWLRLTPPSNPGRLFLAPTSSGGAKCQVPGVPACPRRGKGREREP